MCDKAGDTYPSSTKFVSECLMNQQKCDNAVNIYLFLFHSIPDWYKTQEMRHRVVSNDPF